MCANSMKCTRLCGTTTGFACLEARSLQKAAGGSSKRCGPPRSTRVAAVRPPTERPRTGFAESIPDRTCRPTRSRTTRPAPVPPLNPKRAGTDGLALRIKDGHGLCHQPGRKAWPRSRQVENELAIHDRGPLDRPQSISSRSGVAANARFRRQAIDVLGNARRGDRLAFVRRQSRSQVDHPRERITSSKRCRGCGDEGRFITIKQRCVDEPLDDLLVDVDIVPDQGL